MPENKEKCLDIINKYLSLPDEERLNFGLGRRAGYYERLADLDNSDKHYKIAELMTRVRSHGESVDSAIFKLKDSFI